MRVNLKHYTLKIYLFAFYSKKLTWDVFTIFFQLNIFD
ncbi:hypothetical protein D1BOALGB6SA_3940 [Olavius sp. associated proteobacterium Delta 1]|nr:hypothetical protein D1BOALGB6SA_3940 [Olavius sp. associated proteobacterium Delta 1]